jgi:poly-gamma-glutamate synthesis protein (capsule biosynthesis protein)
LKRILPNAVFILSLLIGLYSTYIPPISKHVATEERDSSFSKDSIVSVQLSAVGDIMCHSTQFNYARVGKDSFDFKPVFDSIRKYLRRSDFVAGNLETVIADSDKNYAGYPVFNTPPDFLEGLKYAGFSHLIVANNHILDRGLKGLQSTLKKIRQYGFTYSGANIPNDSIRIFSIKGIKFAFLSFTYFINNPDKNLKKYIETITPRNIIEKISRAKKKGAEITIVYFHFGKEYERFPNAAQKQIARTAVKAGADLIIASHTHVVQPADFIRRGQDSVFVLYSMGNFLSNQRWRYSDGGVILNIRLIKNISRDSVYIGKISFLPIWVFKGKINSKRQYLIYPMPKAPKHFPSFFSKEDSINATQSFFDTDSIIRAYGVNIPLEQGNNFDN